MVRKHIKLALAAALPLVLATGCSEFLKGGELTNDPNAPTAATLNQRFVSIQANMFQLQEGDLARLLSMWVQSMAGTDRQFLLLGTYVISASDEDGEFQRAYVGGGLWDVKQLEIDGATLGDSTYVGIGRIFEAWFVSTIADFWGDVPYSQAANKDFPQPVYDAQLSVYDSAQKTLSAAISALQSATGPGPGHVDLVYGTKALSAQRAAWIELAHTLKARLYLHTAEIQAGRTAAYQNALAEAQQGISSNANDYIAVLAGTNGEWNDWYQFITIQRSGYMSAGEALVDTLANLDDPRLDDFYAPGDTTAVVGALPGTQYTSVMGNLSALRLDPAYPQPMVTYNENLLIQAEAQYELGNAAPALTLLNTERAAWGSATAWHGAMALGNLGSASFHAIMTEKWIAMFQNIESYNDYRRTCIPELVPAPNAAVVPARILYPTSELSTNGANVPQPDPVHNTNDPYDCSPAGITAAGFIP